MTNVLWVLDRVAVVKHDVSENILPPSSVSLIPSQTAHSASVPQYICTYRNVKMEGFCETDVFIFEQET
jgi:hypothetical protein